jgi:hypothetical protein
LPDSGFNCLDLPDAAPHNGPTCDPVDQLGCEPCDKCDQLVAQDEPLLATTSCVPRGTKQEGETCTRGEPGPLGYSDCDRGLYCDDGVCTSICRVTPEDTCRDESEPFGTGSYCTFRANLFSSSEGVCDSACHPTAETIVEGVVVNDGCPDELEGCYLNAIRGSATCAFTAATYGQNHTCHGSPPGLNCYLNGCGSGFAALLPNSAVNATSTQCARYCTPNNAHMGSQDQVQGTSGNCASASLDALGGTGLNTSEHQCRFIQTFFGNTDRVPAEVGMCVPVQPLAGGTWGDCRLLDWEGIQGAWNAAIAGGTNPNDALEDYCLVNPDDPQNSAIKDSCLGLFRGCISREERDSKLPEPTASALPSTSMWSRFPSPIAMESER